MKKITVFSIALVFVFACLVLFGFMRASNNLTEDIVDCTNKFDKLIHDERLISGIWRRLNLVLTQQSNLTFLESDNENLNILSFPLDRHEQNLMLNLYEKGLNGIEGLDESSIVEFLVDTDGALCKQNIKEGSFLGCQVIQTKVSGSKRTLTMVFELDSREMRVHYRCVNRARSVNDEHVFKYLEK